MEIKLNNIGIISDSSIKLDGLTIITGKNNSGKTTVGKALFAVLDAMNDIPQKAKRDKNNYITKTLLSIKRDFLIFGLSYRGSTTKDIANKYPTIDEFLFSSVASDVPDSWDLESKASLLLSELKEITADQCQEIVCSSLIRSFFSNKGNSKQTAGDFFEGQRKKAIASLEKMLLELNNDENLIMYTKESINQSLISEFAGQIQPVSKRVKNSLIELNDGTSTIIRVEISDNIVTDNTIVLSVPYKKVYLIDDPFIIDAQVDHSLRINQDSQLLRDSFFDINRVLSHNEKLKQVLLQDKRPSILEQTILDEKYGDIRNIINDVLPGSFDISRKGHYYLQGKSKLNVSNLATGSKLFSIIKILFEKGELIDGTMLILDEPESHLHPEWQNIFAKIIAKMVKEMGISVLLTTHSPNFLLAIDAFMREYAITDKVNFYMFDNDSNSGRNTFQCVNDNISEIYKNFLTYLAQMKALRDKYVFGTAELS